MHYLDRAPGGLRSESGSPVFQQSNANRGDATETSQPHISGCELPAIVDSSREPTRLRLM